MKETFTERLERRIFHVVVKCNNFMYGISFPTLEEAEKYRNMYPNITMIIFASLHYDKAENALAPQKLAVIE